MLSFSERPASPPDTTAKPDTTVPDTVANLKYPIGQPGNEPFNGFPQDNPLYLNDPKNITPDIQYDPSGNQYIFTEKAGTLNLTQPNYMSFNDYLVYDQANSLRNYWKQRSQAASMDKQNPLIPQIHFGGEVFDRIFGSSTIDIRPSGSAELTFGIIGNRRDDPNLSIRQRRTFNFDFQEKIQMNVIAKIGDKIEFNANYNTEATFDFENKLKLKYEGKEDEIIKLIEAGDVTLPLNSTLITGSQSLFGIKTKLQFGRTTVTSVFSQQKSQSSSITVAGGAQTTNFRMTADQYEDNKHFFLAQYFRNHYEEGLKRLPIISSPVNITKIEVWVTTIGAAIQDNRNIVAFQDLGEYSPYNTQHIHPISPPNGQPNMPCNRSNDLTKQLDTAKVRDISTVSNYLASQFNFTSGVDYQVVGNAKKLSQSEYTFNRKLGFISLNTALNSDQVLAVAYQYTVIGSDSVFQVGEFSDQGIASPKNLLVKLLKSTNLNTRIPMWNLMMKNVYSIGGYQINKDDFVLNILYSGNENGVPTGYLSEGPADVKGQPLIQVMNLDNLDPLQNPNPDGFFDFIDGAAAQGGTIQASNGRVYFTVLEPFGGYLRKKLNDPILADKFCYDSLYTMTKSGAQQIPSKNKFLLDGYYKSASSSEISLNAINVPQGSVKVTSGGIQLTENVDYTVDYTLGRVKIINAGILNSGTPINISLESNSMFNIQTKTLLGSHVDYMFNKDFHVGATLLNLTERPLTQKVNFGDEPISNTIFGFDLAYQKESKVISKILDKLPFYSTKSPSKINFEGEFADLIPGHSKAIGKTGVSYIDDFEGTKSTIDLKTMQNWYLASTPQGQSTAAMFPEGARNTGLKYGFNRARLAWYIIDPSFYEKSGGQRPSNVSLDDISRNSVRPVRETEVFPSKEPPNGQVPNISVMNVVFYPDEKGPYNYDVTGEAGYSYGIGADGRLKNPSSRWGGIMRKLETSDFEATNIQTIEFWMMDPFSDDTTNNGGDLYFNLGDISEDVLRDSRMFFEQGLPTTTTVTNVDTTLWGRVPTTQPLVHAFDNNPDSRPFQDVGYDGLRDEDENTFFDPNYISKIATLYGNGSDAYLQATSDPSSDNYHYFRGSDYDNNNLYSSVLERYKLFNGTEGNSPANPSTDNMGNSRDPNEEDINRDNTLSEEEKYFQYKVSLRPEDMKVGQNYIADIFEATGIPLPNGTTGHVKWYQFKIPINSPDKVVGDIQDFKSIRFMRMFLKGFGKTTVCRFASLDLVRNEWRKYSYELLTPGEYLPTDDQSLTSFDLSTVSFEENGSREPIPYVLPPDIDREINVGTTSLQQLNEQSMVMKVGNLFDGDARAAYKTSDLDLRQYKKIRMFTHAEKVKGLFDNGLDYKTGDMTVFIRLGSDFTENYYEYEVPVQFTPWHTSSTDVYGIWPTANNFEIELDKLVSAKQDRNSAIRQDNSLVNANTPYITYDGKNKITVMGMPSLSEVKAIMVGVRNPKKLSGNTNDDGLPKSAEIWVDELRLTDFVENGGWAAVARVNTTLADLGNLIISASHSTPGWGSIEKKVNERQKEAITTFDLATNIELGKLLPQKLGLKIPMHFDYSESRSTPQYNPLDPDVLFNSDLKTYPTKAQQDSIKRITQDFTRRKNLNFINVRKDKTGASKPHIYDIENFDVTYAFSEIYHRNVDIEFDSKKTYHGGLGYNYTINPIMVKPFSKFKLLNKYKAFQLITDFNFYLLPKLLSFRTDLNRQYNERRLRNKTEALVPMVTTVIKKYDWTRNYDMKYDLTQSLRIDYSANSNAYIDEPPGQVTSTTRDSIRKQFMKFGTINNFDQNITVNYNLPINKIPLLSFLSAAARYSADYRWTASPQSVQASLGNTIENGNTKQLNGSLSMSSLYNKIPFLKKLNQANSPQGKGRDAGKQQQFPGKQQPMPGKGQALPPKGKGPWSEMMEPAGDTAKAEKKEVNYFKEIGNGLLRMLIGLKTGSISYTEGNGMSLPGFMPEPDALGNNWNLDAPGIGFILGSQQDIRKTARDHNWLTRDTLLNNAYTTKRTENMNVNIVYEPFADFRLEITANRNYTENHQEYYVFDADTGDFKISAPQTTGSFSSSFLSWGTAFVSEGKDNKSVTFENLKNYRYDIAWRLARNNPNWNGRTVDSTGFPEGYSPTSQEVLIPAFLAAYSGKNAASIGLNPFFKIPKPNWRITYSGLSKIEFLKRYLKNVNISHAYRSTFNVGTFTTNVLYREKNGAESAVNDANNFIPEREISQVSISEQFSPLFDIDMTWNNNLLSKLEVKKSRNLSMSFVNNQLTEVISNEVVVGLGYRFKDVQFIVRTLGGANKTRKLKSDLNLKLDVAVKKNKTMLRRVDENLEQVSSGQNEVTANFSAEYNLSPRFNVKFYFDKRVMNPFVSSQYPNSDTKGGITLRFTLAQ